MASPSMRAASAAAPLPDGRFLLHRRIHAIALAIEDGFTDVSAKLDQLIEALPTSGSDRVAIFFALSVTREPTGKLAIVDGEAWGAALMRADFRQVAQIADLPGSTGQAAQKLLTAVPWPADDTPTQPQAEQIVAIARKLVGWNDGPTRATPARRRVARTRAGPKD